MKIKHWAGYGCVNASKVKDSACTLHVRVEGNHEQGVVREDPYTLYLWLVKRFDKSAADITTWLKSHPIIDVRSDFRVDPVLGYLDICNYYFIY